MSISMVFVRLEGTKARMRKLMKDISSRATTIIRGVEGIIYVALPSQELSWIDKVAKDDGVHKAEIQGLPKHDRALCGVLTVNLHKHIGRCRKCQELKPRKPHSGEVITVAKVEGLQELSLNGLISVMKQKMDEAMALAQEWDIAIKAVEKIPELQAQVNVLSKQMEEHRQALELFTKGG